MFYTSKATVVAAVAALLAGALASPAPAEAQQPTTVTGCLSKGADDNSYGIKGEDGKSHTLSSATVALEGHVGHKVKVTGTPAGVETGVLTDTGMVRDTGTVGDTGMTHREGMPHDTSMTKEMDLPKETTETGGGSLNVTSLEHVSAECK